MKIRGGRASPQEYCNQHGKGLEQVLSEIAEFREMMQAKGLGDVADAWLVSRSANTPKSGMRPDGTDHGGLDAGGDGQTGDDAGT